MFANKLLLISVGREGETDLEGFLLPWVWFCCCGMLSFAVAGGAVPARERAPLLLGTALPNQKHVLQPIAWVIR